MGFLICPTVESLTEALDGTLRDEYPPMNTVARAQQYDWDAVADQAETAYQRAIDGIW